jgi:CRISPR-associated endonuclease Csn1
MYNNEIKYSLGLNISTTAIGWGIIDENSNIIDAGVRLFTEAGLKMLMK